MKSFATVKTAGALIVGVITGALSITIVLQNYSLDTHSHGEGEEEFHIHADFLTIVNDTKIDLTADKYMSVAGRKLAENVHLHDHKDDVIHFHAPNVTLVEFMTSLSLPLTKDCLTLETKTYCTNDRDILRLYVNNTDKTSELATYVPQDNDRILLYYGTKDNPAISTYQNQVTDRACMYTGTCPERGTPPPEECGLSCDI